MKRLITLALVAIAITAQAQNYVDPYRPLMDALDTQGDNILKEYRAIQQKDPKGEKPESRAKAKILSDRLDSIGDEQIKLIMQIVRDNRDNQLPVMYILDALYDLSYEDLKVALDPKTAYYNAPELNKAKALLAGYEKRKPGIQFHELEMLDTNDQPVKLSQWVGKGNYVLIDFWASWYRPCLREMPYVIASYEKYHNKGFEVVGVSLDQQKSAWTAAIQQMDLKWPQMSDLKKWESIAVETYGVLNIPANVLVDPQGKIIAMDLRREELANKLKEIYGE